MSSCLNDSSRAGGDADLFEDQVDVGDHLGHRMLDLDARVHLDEVELAVLVEELDGADAEIVELAHGLGDGLADLVARGGIERRRGASSSTFWWRRCSEQSRSPRWMALPLPSPSTWISMWRGFCEIFLDIDRVVAERGLGFGARGRRARVASRLRCVRDLHAASAAAGRGLDQHRIADLVGDSHAPRRRR